MAVRDLIASNKVSADRRSAEERTPVKSDPWRIVPRFSPAYLTLSIGTPRISRPGPANLIHRSGTYQFRITSAHSRVADIFGIAACLTLIAHSLPNSDAADRDPEARGALQE